jgi:hypothetical protein
MALPVPDWLAKRGGDLRAKNDGRSWVVSFDNAPQYLLAPVPVKGQHSCQITQMINGKRLDSGGIYPSVEDALRGGLEDLRKALGW